MHLQLPRTAEQHLPTAALSTTCRGDRAAAGDRPGSPARAYRERVSAASGPGAGAGGVRAAHAWLGERVQRLSDEHLRAGRDPVALLRTLVEPGEQAFVVATGSSRVVAFRAGGDAGQEWWATTLPTASRPAAGRLPGGAPPGGFGWEHWSAYVRRRHLVSLLLIGPADSATSLAEQVLRSERGPAREHLVNAALAAVAPQERAAAEFLLALAGHAVGEQLPALSLTADEPAG